VGPRVRLTADELDALPVKSARTFECGGVLLPMWKSGEGQWRITQRQVPGRVLADLYSVERRLMRRDEATT
jgi:hypothetical protein